MAPALDPVPLSALPVPIISPASPTLVEEASERVFFLRDAASQADRDWASGIPRPLPGVATVADPTQAAQMPEPEVNGNAASAEPPSSQRPDDDLLSLWRNPLDVVRAALVDMPTPTPTPSVLDGHRASLGEDDVADATP